MFCSTHRMQGMVDAIHKRCEQNGCQKTPSFAFKGNKAMFCCTHRLEGMVDVNNKRWQHPECKLLQGYNGNLVYVSSMIFSYSHLQIFNCT